MNDDGIKTINPDDIEQIEQITRIYNYYVENTIITFDEVKVSHEEMKKRVTVILKKYPWIVYKKGRKVLGYAYASQFRKRSAYRYSTETTIYLDPECLGKGVGKILYSELLNRIRDMEYRVAYGCIALPNPASVILHEKLGFKKVAHLSEVGYKFDRWIDVGYWELKL